MDLTFFRTMVLSDVIAADTRQIPGIYTAHIIRVLNNFPSAYRLESLV